MGRESTHLARICENTNGCFCVSTTPQLRIHAQICSYLNMVLSASRRTFCTICIKIYHILIVVGVGGGRFDGVQPCTRAARRVASVPSSPSHQCQAARRISAEQRVASVPSSTLYQAEQHVATSDRQPATVNQQPSTSNRQPATVNQQRSTSNQQPATSNQQQAFVAMPGTSIECQGAIK